MDLTTARLLSFFLEKRIFVYVFQAINKRTNQRTDKQKDNA